MSKSEHSRSESERTTKIPKTTGAKNRNTPLEYFAPEANTVAVAGDFNGWDTQAHMLKKSKAGWWKTNLKLPPGRYQYRFIVNGEQWSEDPENPNKEANEFDSYNSILEVR